MNLADKISDPIFKKVAEIAQSEQVETFVIGGFVRDLLLDRIHKKDIDFVVLGDGIAFAKTVADKLNKKKYLSVFKNFGTAMIRLNDQDLELEFVGARKESYRRDSRKPIVENGSLQDDQNRRDFTINAMSISLNSTNYGELIDPFNGLDDLENKVIRTPLEPDQTYSDDPLRMMRAIRFATQLNFKISQESFEAISRNKDRIRIISAERITAELNQIMKCPKPSIGFDLLYRSGLLEIILPEIHALQGVEEVDGQTHKDNFYHTIEVVDNISRTTDNLWSRWAALLHDIGKPKSKRFDKNSGWTFHGHEFLGSKMIPRIFKRLKLPMNDKMRYVQKLVKLSSRPAGLAKENVTDSAVRRLVHDAGNDIEELMLLVEADITSKNKKLVKKYLNNFKLVREKLIEIEEKDQVRNFQPPVSGIEIIEAFDLKPCKEIGIIKHAIKEAILEGTIPNEREAAQQFMIEKGKELGLTYRSK
ncbi:MAG: tRNA nucleotidyltransferase [Crocinitomicaceae bacterium]|nr:tRNA nucleotidyltransferase [Crocinitomicaceae bacterium]|tara:strand:- start:4504 stop:5931 length:1428 start_codon:yes stop_codon:yes gene_type:complete